MKAPAGHATEIRVYCVVFFCTCIHFVQACSTIKWKILPHCSPVKVSDVLMPDLHTLPLNSTLLGELAKLLKLLKFAHANPKKSIKIESSRSFKKHEPTRVIRFYETCRIYSDIWFRINSVLNAISQSSNYSISQYLEWYAIFGDFSLID